ncbi:MAG TPA: hypothetical protein PKV44_01875 [Bacillota bacterium]|nr:hypothetical protein [Bacillota bacterium]HPE38309.1 hypothetical protein [Bacillota bacterium]
MNWNTVGSAIPEIASRDLAAFHLSMDDAAILARDYNRALKNMTNDCADMALVTLKTIISKYPTWGEPSLMFGICVAQTREFHRACSCFEHALASGLHSMELTELAQMCLTEAQKALESQKHGETEKPENPFDKIRSTGSRIEAADMVTDSEHRERVHMQAPILIKAPRNPARRKLATDKERRDVLMQSTSSNGEIPDDDIEIDMPKTPTERLRIAVIAISVFALLVAGFFVGKYVVWPYIEVMNNKKDADERLEFVALQLEENANDPACSSIIDAYHEEYGEDDYFPAADDLTESEPSSEVDPSSPDVSASIDETIPSDTTAMVAPTDTTPTDVSAAPSDTVTPTDTTVTSSTQQPEPAA